ncbi:MAG: substrate-binding domain-containing protein [bacterium]
MKRILFVMLALMFLLAGFTVFAGGQGEAEAGEAKGDYVIGISNSLFGNSWRESMIDSMKEVAEFYIDKGMLKSYIVQQSGPDVQTQIQQIRNMINEGVDMIIINPASATGLTGVIEEAADVGIPSIVMDAELLGDDRELALSVATDKFVETYTSGSYIAEKMGGEGNVITLLGNAAYQPTQKRQQGFEAVYEENPGLNELAVVYGEWNQATAEAVMNDVVATYQDIDAVMTTGSMAMGALRAFMNAGKDLPHITGDPTVEFILFCKEQMEAGADFEFAAPLNPPGIGATALAIGIYQLNGYELKEDLLENNVFYYDLETDFISRENIDRFLDLYEGEDPSVWITEWASDDVVKTWFE